MTDERKLHLGSHWPSISMPKSLGVRLNRAHGYEILLPNLEDLYLFQLLNVAAGLADPSPWARNLFSDDAGDDARSTISPVYSCFNVAAALRKKPDEPSILNASGESLQKRVAPVAFVN
jgi:hypothetical protein